MNSDFNGHFLDDLRDFSLGSAAPFMVLWTLWNFLALHNPPITQLLNLGSVVYSPVVPFNFLEC